MKVFKALRAVVGGIFGCDTSIVRMVIMLSFSALSIAGLVLLTFFLVHAGPWAPEQCTGELVHYTNSEFGYSLDYPKCWLFQSHDDNNGISIVSKDREFMLMITAGNHQEPFIGSMPNLWFADLTEESIESVFCAGDCTNLNVYMNEPALGKWDWVAAFTLTCYGTPSQGEHFIKETQSTSYFFWVIQKSLVDWSEGQDVLNSFKVVN